VAYFDSRMSFGPTPLARVLNPAISIELSG
jgi:hypothetical protein